jgi:hypothetical protein
VQTTSNLPTVMQNHNRDETPRSISPDAEVIDLTGLSIAPSDGSTRDSDREMSEDTSVPWYQDPNGTHPFSLTVKSRVSSGTLPAIQTL